MKKSKTKQNKKTQPRIGNQLARTLFWFFLGVALGLFFFSSFVFIYYKKTYAQVIYPGVYINSIDFGGKTPEEVKSYFQQKNEMLNNTAFTFVTEDHVATIAARDLKLGYDADLQAEQAFSIGRSNDLMTNVHLVFQAYLRGVNLPASYMYDSQKLDAMIKPIATDIYKEPVDALFNFENGKVTQFRTSSNGEKLDTVGLQKTLVSKIPMILQTKPAAVTITIPITTTKPQVITAEVNDMGIKELVASGSSLFRGSIENRVYNITLAANKINGVLIKPGEVFSFNKTIGSISTLTGFKQAYVIQSGKTVLGDGGGVCQVSTTLFRAALNAGLPIVERNAHAYRVSYYEQNSAPGVDAAIYEPTVDLKFKNDTGHHLLIQTFVDPENYALTFELYGTKDNREVTISKPVITSVTSSPEPLYIDDPNLPKGEVKQIEHAVAGATVYFTRTVKKGREVIADDKFPSYYKAWQAVYMRGTKEG